MTEQQPKTVAELVQRIEKSWNAFYAYIDTLSEAQLTQPTDAVGWTAKDHLIHLASWEDTLNALLEKKPQWENMGVEKSLWDSGDVDKINGILQKRYQAMPLSEVRQKHQKIHQRLMANIRTLADEDLQRPARDFQPDSKRTHPIVRPLIADTYEAYEEHTPWIAAIVTKPISK
jgi:hypothetical protein